MEKLNLAETISSVTENAINSNQAVIMGQCLTAVGWVGGTIPAIKNHANIIELSMADVAGGGIAVGSALDLRHTTIYVVRYQGFLWYNAISIANYAAKSYELFKVPCPLLVRAIAMEGSIGPVAGNSHISLLLRMPGINIASPMTPNEWIEAWKFHHSQKILPTVISEHRLSFNISDEMDNRINDESKITILAISSARLNALEAISELDRMGVKVDLFHQVWLSPLKFPEGFNESLNKTKKCLVIDNDYQSWGPSENLAYKIQNLFNVRAYALGLESKSAGFSASYDNLPPTKEKILLKVDEIISRDEKS